MEPVRELTKPKTLKPGSTLAVVSPASTPKPELVERGLEALHALGYKTVLYSSALQKGPLYYAGTVEERLRDLHAAFADPAIDGIICTRGGWGSAELLPYLDAALIRANPKAFLGYSDHTSLHMWLRNEANLVSFYAPMVAADFSRENGGELASWRHVFDGDSTWSLSAEDGLRILRPGIAEGQVNGGCLSIFTEGLGTPYGPRAEGGILFLEEVGTKPYQWDRMLLHLRLAGMFDGVTGVVFGDMAQCVSSPAEEELLEGALMHALRDFAGPIAIGLRSGHVSTPNITMPLGIRARLDLTDAGNPRMHFLEAATAG